MSWAVLWAVCGIYFPTLQVCSLLFLVAVWMQSSCAGLCWVSLGQQLKWRPGCWSSFTKNIRTRKGVALWSCVLGEGAAVRAEGIFPEWLQDVNTHTILRSQNAFVAIFSFHSPEKDVHMVKKFGWVSHVQDSHRKEQNFLLWQCFPPSSPTPTLHCFPRGFWSVIKCSVNFSITIGTQCYWQYKQSTQIV